MKTKILLTLLVSSLALTSAPCRAAESSDAKEELKALVGKVQTKLKDGKNSEADLGPELKEFDELLAKHKGEKTDDVAQILLMKAMLFAQVLDDDEKAKPLLEQVKRDYPDTKPGKNVDQILENMSKQAEAKKIRRSLKEGTKFPDFEEKDLDGKALSIANYKGKVVLVDFWATWCGPCVGELPNVLKAYEANHAKGFEIIGISLDQDEKKLRDFIKDRKMPWQQFFDGKGWGNKLAAKYGVNSIPATYLLDGEGKIIGKDLRGDALSEAVTKALIAK